MPPVDRKKPVHGSTVNNIITPKKAIIKLITIKNICNARSIIF